MVSTSTAVGMRGGHLPAVAMGGEGARGAMGGSYHHPIGSGVALTALQLHIAYGVQTYRTVRHGCSMLELRLTGGIVSIST